MTRQTQVLSILLGVQIVLAAILYFTEADIGAFVSNEKLLGLQFDVLTKIAIEEAPNTTLVLEKQNQNWKLPGYFGFPASREKLDRIFKNMLDKNVDWPVATTASAGQRFKVASDSFERKLTFSSASASEILYLGTSPGFKKIHARIDGKNDIYAIEFSAYQASTKPIDWADQSILHVPRDEIDAIEIAGLRLQRDKHKFALEGLDPMEETVDSEAQTLLSNVSSLGFQEVLGNKDDPAYQLDKPALVFSLVKKDNQKIEYRYGRLKDKEDYVLKASGSDYYFLIPKYNVDTLSGFDRKKLVILVPPPAPIPAPETEPRAGTSPPTKVAPAAVQPPSKAKGK
ncbi:MAG: DUF4340 domain-containing protein [Methylococcales bacterium]